MKKCLFISFDIFREGEIQKSYSVYSIILYLKKKLGDAIECDDISLNMLDKVYDLNGAWEEIVKGRVLSEYDLIFIPDYAWSAHITKPLMCRMREFGYKGGIVAGGYEVTSTPDDLMKSEYPDADYYVKGYAEESVYRIVKGDAERKVALCFPFDINDAPSLYLSGDFNIGEKIKMIRWETKRGCPYSCGFCEWGAHNDKKVMHIGKERILQELALFGGTNINKINLLDGTFNLPFEGSSVYLDLMEEMAKYPKIIFHFQTRFENIKGEQGERFLDLCTKYDNFYLEFGLQTAVPEEMKTLHRKNDLERVKTVMKELNKRAIRYEVNLIYGIPGQTIESFKKSCDFLIEAGCRPEKIIAFPLRVPKAGKIREQNRDIEEHIVNDGNFKVKLVTACRSFDQDGWDRMNFINAYFEMEKDFNASSAGEIKAKLNPEKFRFDGVLYDALHFNFSGQSGNKWKLMNPAMFMQFNVFELQNKKTAGGIYFKKSIWRKKLKVDKFAINSRGLVDINREG